MLTLRRDHFLRSRDLTAYKELRTAAEAVGGWTATRAWALDQLRPKADSPHPTAASYYHSVFIDVLLWEGDNDAAWTAAHRYAASAAQWSRLAGLRKPAHPEDAIGVYQRMITQNLVNGGGGYAEAADLAVRIRALYTRIDATEQATAHLTGLRSAHKRKRNFMAELDRRGLP